jgi:Flp pilus assembly protein TadD
LGGALLRYGQAAQAEAVFRKDLEINPRNGRSLYGLLESLRAQGRSVDAAWVEKQFAEARKRADVGLDIGKL